jgi:hypothetical protein
MVIESCLPDCKYGPRVKVWACKKFTPINKVAIKKTGVFVCVKIFINWILGLSLALACTLAYRMFMKISKTKLEIKAQSCSIFSKRL